MSTATWGEPRPLSSEAHSYPSTLLKSLLQQMMAQLGATGACLALFDESVGQMVVRCHVRFAGMSIPSPSSSPSPSQTPTPTVSTSPNSTRPLTLPASPVPSSFTQNGLGFQNNSATLVSPASTPTPRNPTTDDLSNSSSSAPGRQKREMEEVSSQQSDIFPVGTYYPPGYDLIGYAWSENKMYGLRYEDYLANFRAKRQRPFFSDAMPTWFLVVPIEAPSLNTELHSQSGSTTFPSGAPKTLGVIVLYQTAGGVGFHQRQRPEALQFAERIALYLQNDRLQQAQRRSSKYMQLLQQISTAFPTKVSLSKLVGDIYQFIVNVVDASSMLLTFYDRDRNKIYDVFAVRNGQPVTGLPEHPVIMPPQDRPVWSRVILEEKRSLLLEPAQLKGDDYDELLGGTWGDQRQAESFLLLPMKMFNRAVGSLCLSSTHAHAYREEEIQVLETMVQIITVSIENAHLYERDRQSLREARQRELMLAAMNSALQAISSVWNVSELLHKFVEFVAKLVEAEMCIFFQLTKDKEELVAQAEYATPKPVEKQVPDPNDPDLIVETEALELDMALGQHTGAGPHIELLEMIRLPFAKSVIEQLVSQSAFFHLEPSMIEELTLRSSEGGAIFLHDTEIQRLLMIPVQYQTELIGILGVYRPKHLHMFQPQEVGTLLAICGQTASALRNAQFFEQIQENNAELQRMNTLKDEFLVTASHELRTPLSAISGYATMLKRQIARNDLQNIQRYVAKLVGAAQQLTELVTSMTDAANIGVMDKNMDVQMSAVEVRSAVDVALTMLNGNIEQKITTTIPSGLWVYGDPLRVRNVITYLLDNAAKYSPPDGHIEVIVSTMQLSQLPLDEQHRNHNTLVKHDPETPVVLFRFYDEGEGIPPEDQQRIFEKFVRASRSLTTTVRGTGLGLYMGQRYIEAMDGQLWLEQSTPGSGSIFSFYLLQMLDPPEK